MKLLHDTRSVRAFFERVYTVCRYRVYVESLFWWFVALVAGVLRRFEFIFLWEGSDVTVRFFFLMFRSQTFIKQYDFLYVNTK